MSGYSKWGIEQILSHGLVLHCRAVFLNHCAESQWHAEERVQMCPDMLLKCRLIEIEYKSKAKECYELT